MKTPLSSLVSALLFTALLTACAPDEKKNSTVLGEPALDTVTGEIGDVTDESFRQYKYVDALSLNWEFSSGESLLQYLSVKKRHVIEHNHFSQFHVRLHDDNTATMKIDLFSVSSGISVRDERIRNYLFDTDTFAMAEAEVAFDKTCINLLKPGRTVLCPLTTTLKLHGVERAFESSARIAWVGINTLQVKSQQPVLIKASDYAMLEGIQALKKLAGVDDITETVMVEYLLTFNLKS